MQTSPGSDKHDRWIWALAILVVATSIGIAARFSLYGHTNRRMDIGLFRHYAVSDAVWFAAGMALLTAIYGLAIIGTTLQVRRFSPVAALMASLGAGIAFATMYPVTAIDIFNYAGQSRIWTDLGRNPNVVPIGALPASKWTVFGGEWVTKPSPYGPMWRWLSAPATLASGDNLMLAVVLLKILALLAVVTTAWLIGDIVARSGRSRALGIVAYGWNPLVLWEGIGNGHNDTIIALFLVAALWFWQRDRHTATVPLMFAGSWIKYTLAIAAPPIALASLLRARDGERKRLLGWWIVDCSLLALIIFWPFYALRPLFDTARVQGRITLTSPLWLLEQRTSARWGRDAIEAVYKPVAAIILLMVLLVLWLWLIRYPDRLIPIVAGSLGAYLLIGAWQFRAWYLIPVIAATAATGEGRWIARSTVWATGSLAAYWIFIWAHPLWGWNQGNAIQFGTLLMFGPLLVLLIWDAGRVTINFQRRSTKKTTELLEPGQAT